MGLLRREPKFKPLPKKVYQEIIEMFHDPKLDVTLGELADNPEKAEELDKYIEQRYKEARKYCSKHVCTYVALVYIDGSVPDAHEDEPVTLYLMDWFPFGDPWRVIKISDVSDYHDFTGSIFGTPYSLIKIHDYYYWRFEKEMKFTLAMTWFQEEILANVSIWEAHVSFADYYRVFRELRGRMPSADPEDVAFKSLLELRKRGKIRFREVTEEYHALKNPERMDAIIAYGNQQATT